MLISENRVVPRMAKLMLLDLKTDNIKEHDNARN